MLVAEFDCINNEDGERKEWQTGAGELEELVGWTRLWRWFPSFYHFANSSVKSE